ncbi:carbamoyltransferase HypF [Helicobacter cholecystus]|uniref:Carbamoyltransferase n=1 Tax=Helicobacter cholecystus TaxID=45498 RepID=A0A3D8IYC9_9HELI|nr:carbamoyltransferase HypF [Helicobacter cholecystus]RDU69561.1 carbamoyltransferase HypF [Helicobacter cholecystus]VEJ24117.1 transcriptional regulatory protein HypF [Helicobacter cholecystus]
MKSLKLQIQGKIQGVGFRPFIANLAASLGLCGYVKNNALGVEVLLQGERSGEFLSSFPQKAPKISEIQKIEVFEFDYPICEGFEILKSEQAENYSTLLIPELGICQDCKNDLFAQENSRFFYPLINCTNCGPRYSVIKALPYDRERTSMSEFMMCKKCREEYTRPQSRFFHAQPISCPQCGPKFFYNNEVVMDYKKTFFKLAQKIKQGEIVLIQGLGGFHLVCDATNIKSIAKLRLLKDRPRKPLALMCKDIEQVKAIAYVSKNEQQALLSPKAPIVLLKAKQYLEGIAPSLNTYAIMLSYTPIYELLFSFLDFPLVVTSANPKGEPIIYKREELKKLFSLTSIFLSHQREILNPVEDSIIQILSTQDEVVLRNARGYAPVSFRLSKKIASPLLAVGGNQKASFAIAFEDILVLSPYIGDLDNVESIERFKSSIAKLQALYGILRFESIVCDLHPQYQSTMIAKELAEKMNSNLVQIQHHYAHTLSVCFEHQINSEVLSFCFDGTGYGEDGKIWGGEVLLGSLDGFKRLAHFKYFKLLGGEVAFRDIGRIFYSLAFDYLSFQEVQELKTSKNEHEIKTLYQMHQKSLNSPQTSSVGRLFDFVAFICGLETQSYEGESGVLLQNLYCEKYAHISYNFKLNNGEIELDFVEMFQDYLKESKERIASKFINTLINLVLLIAQERDCKIVLCGGVFCNNILSEKILEKLRKSGKSCYIGNKIPPNDNGLALGQMYYLLKE